MLVLKGERVLKVERGDIRAVVQGRPMSRFDFTLDPEIQRFFVCFVVVVLRCPVGLRHV